MVPTLHTPHFVLTEVVATDQAFLFEALGNPEAMPYNGVYYTSFEETTQQLEWYRRNEEAGTGLHWKVVQRESSEPIGVVSVYYYKPEHNKAELGYWLLPRYWKQGIASEVLPFVISYWQQERGLHRLEAFVETENVASFRLLEKLGFVLEGTMVDCERKFGRYISLRIYALLANQPTLQK